MFSKHLFMSLDHLILTSMLAQFFLILVKYIYNTNEVILFQSHFTHEENGNKKLRIFPRQSSKLAKQNLNPGLSLNYMLAIILFDWLLNLLNLVSKSQYQEPKQFWFSTSTSFHEQSADSLTIFILPYLCCSNFRSYIKS